MPFIYGLCNKNSREAELVYHKPYPNKKIDLNLPVFIGVHNVYLERHISNPPHRERRHNVNNDKKVLLENATHLI